MAPLSRAHATLRIYREGGTVHEVSTRLGVAPSDAHDAGGPRPRGATPWPHMMWSLSSGETDARPLGEHLRVLLDQVDSVADAIRDLANDGYEMDWFCFLDVDGGQGGDALEPALVQRLAALPIALSFDICSADDPWQPLTPPTRAEVEARWSRLIDGQISRESVHAWAEPFMFASLKTQPDPMTMSAVQSLHGFDLTHSGNPNVISHGPPGTYLRSMSVIAQEFEEWQRRCREYDSDPDGWLAQRRDEAQKYRRFDRFVISARSFCAWVEGLPHPSTNCARFEEPLSLLADLLADGYRLPDVEPSSTDLPPGIGHDEWSCVFRKTAAWWGDDDRYWTVSGDGIEPGEPTSGSLADDLADTWRDIRAGLSHLDAGALWTDVAWQFRFDLTTHWGRHAADAVRALQYAGERDSVGGSH